MMNLSVRISLVICQIPFCLGLFGQNASNPFLRPGSNKPSPPAVVRQAPPPPAPIPRNQNLEFRGYFKYENEWNFAIYDKSKSQGVWLKKGESSDDGNIQIIDFNPQLHEVHLKGGLKLVLKDSENKVLSVPSGQAIPKKQKNSPVPPPLNARSIPPPRLR